MNTWNPITDEEFSELFNSQYAELNGQERKAFDRYRVRFWKATIQRSKVGGDECVFVVSQRDNGVLYFDDVEYGFNISTVDDAGRILFPGGSSNTLREAVLQWFDVQ